MSFLGKLFGGGKSESKQDEKVSPSIAIQKLRDTEEMLLKKQEYYERLIKEQEAIIKANGTKNKKVALAALKKKKRLEKQMETQEGTLTTLEFQREALENANTNTEVLKNMGLAAKALKTVHNSMDVDKVEDLMEDVREQQQMAEEIVNVITDKSAFGQNIDEDELIKELEELEQEELDKQLLDAGTLPEAPQTELKEAIAATSSKSKDAEEDELEALKQWAT
ncbi:charged multivesicular body protein 4c-like [Panonychus citri]|uniref:charged multivesicular body protein 4c-like n=1 Tax=Panonychus citri TaxID=50023 RepID=UPI0023073D66|nr:charged multivesicular body protein 4c-like [Panonychus citri]XP_053205325.1 charged multivesicular body protein 4c-like [Panonychus citri]